MGIPHADRTRLDVDRVQVRYLVPADHPDAEAVRRRLDETARRELPGAVAAIVAPWFAAADERLWFVRRLDVDVAIDAGSSREDVGRSWGAAVARALVTTLRPEAGDDNVVVFRDRADYLARFLVDLAAGWAWNRWYYDGFAGLKALPVSAAIRTATGDDPAIGRAALSRLAPAGLVTVLRALTARDAARTLDRLGDGADGRALPRAFEAALGLWSTATTDPGDEERTALGLFVAVCRDDPGLAGPALRDAVRALARLDRLLAARSPAAVDHLLATLAAGDATAWGAAIADGGEPLLPILRCPAATIDAIRAAVQASPSIWSGASAPLGEPRQGAFGGLFLLLPSLDELRLDDAVQDWPDAGATTAAAAVRLLVLARCAGPARGRRVFADPVARDLVGVPPALDETDLARWSTAIAPPDIDRFLARLATRARDEMLLSGKRLALWLVPRRGAPVAVLIDLDSGVWLLARGYRPDGIDRMLARLPAFATELLAEADLVIADESLVGALRARGSAARGEVWAPQDIPSQAEPALAEAVARLDQIPADLAFLARAGPQLAAPPLELALAVAAHGVLRAFSRRLPGFARSGLPYLHRNFLDLPASLIEEPERRVVRLGRPPLNLVLSLTGITRASYRLTWLDDRPLILFQEVDDR